MAKRRLSRIPMNRRFIFTLGDGTEVVGWCEQWTKSLESGESERLYLMEDGDVLRAIKPKRWRIPQPGEAGKVRGHGS